MTVTFSPPVITGNTTDAQLKSMQSWLFQFSEQLQYVLNNLDTSNFTQGRIENIGQTKSSSESNQKMHEEFDSLKSIIIKTADTVKANYEEIKTTLSSEYLAVSEFGEYTEKATAEIRETALGIAQNFTRYEEVSKKLDSVEVSFNNYVKETNAYIRTGYLDHLDAYGVAIGEERTEKDDSGNEYLSFNQFATLTSSELAFWQNGVKLGYFKGDSLFVNGSVRIGRWSIDPNNGFTIKYV